MSTLFIFVGQTPVAIGEQLLAAGPAHGLPRTCFFCLFVHDEAQNWRDSAETGLMLLEKILDILRSLDGLQSLVVVYSPARPSSASFGSRLMQTLAEYLPDLRLTGLGICCPFEATGFGLIHSVLSLQFALTYCDNFIWRCMDDILRLFEQLRCTPPSVEELCRSIALDMLAWALLHSSSLPWLSGTDKVVDVRSSLWHRTFACGPDSVKKDRTPPSRSLSTVIHYLFTTGMEEVRSKEILSLEHSLERKGKGKGFLPAVHFSTLCQINVEALREKSTRPSLVYGDGKFNSQRFRLTVADAVDEVHMRDIERQLTSATPNMPWLNIEACISCCPGSRKKPRVREDKDSSNSSSLANGGVEFAMIFHSPFAEQRLKGILAGARQLICASRGAILKGILGSRSDARALDGPQNSDGGAAEIAQVMAALSFLEDYTEGLW